MFPVLHSLSEPLPASTEAVSSAAVSQLRRYINTSNILDINMSIPLPAPLKTFQSSVSSNGKRPKVPRIACAGCSNICESQESRRWTLDSVLFLVVLVLSQDGKIGSFEAGFQRPCFSGGIVSRVSLCNDQLSTGSSEALHHSNAPRRCANMYVTPSSLCISTVYMSGLDTIKLKHCSPPPGQHPHSHRYTSNGAPSKLQSPDLNIGVGVIHVV